MIRLRLALLALLAAVGLVLAGTGAAMAARAHEVVNDPITCVLNANNTVTCSGSVAGLGNQAVVAQVDADFACETRPGNNQPGGHIQGKTEPIQTRNGRITFSVTSGPASCPPGLNPVVGDFATVTIFDLQGNALFTKRVRIS
jgi:hypothetical protein